MEKRTRSQGWRGAILAELERYNEDELFYKRCCELCGDSPALARYVGSFDLSDLRRRYLILPGDPPVTRLCEDELFKMHRAASGQNILLVKHNRFTPGFIHCHDYFETFIVLTGHCVNTIGGERLTLNPGSLCFIAPEVNHTLEVFDDSIVIKICLRRSTFDEIFSNLLTSPSILQNFFLGSIYPTHTEEYLVFNTNSEAAILQSIFTMLAEQSGADGQSNRIMYHLVSLFFTYLVRMYQRNPAVCRNLEAQKSERWDIVDYVNDNFRTVTLSGTAMRFSMSTTNISRILKLLTGKMFTTLVLEQRIAHAKKMLESSQMKICDIAYALGYENHETFIRIFKKAEGVTPSWWRETKGGADLEQP